MHAADRESVAGQALIADADARLRRIAVLEKFPVRPPRHLLLPLLPALVLAAIVIFCPPAKETQAAGTETAAAPPLEVKKSAEDLRQKLAERRKQAEKEGLKDATELLKKLEEGTKELQTQTDREKALVKLNDLARELQERRKQLGGGSESLKRQMEKVQDIDQRPCRRIGQSPLQGRFPEGRPGAGKTPEATRQQQARFRPRRKIWPSRWSNSSRRSTRWPSRPKTPRPTCKNVPTR